MKTGFKLLLLALAISLLCGCQLSRNRAETATATSPRRGKTPDLSVRNNALSLLADLLGDEKNLSKVLLIKFETKPLEVLVKEISETARQADEAVAAIAAADGVDLSQLNLPVGEIAARETVAKTKQHALLHSKDAEFEFQLLITQAQALGYGAHLARVASENEPHQDHAQTLAALSERLNQLNEKTLAMLRRPH